MDKKKIAFLSKTRICLSDHKLLNGSVYCRAICIGIDFQNEQATQCLVVDHVGLQSPCCESCLHYCFTVNVLAHILTVDLTLLLMTLRKNGV